MMRESKAAPQDCQSDQMDRTVGRDRSGLNGRTKPATANRSAIMPCRRDRSSLSFSPDKLPIAFSRVHSDFCVLSNLFLQAKSFRRGVL
jgi:hypothetical protein